MREQWEQAYLDALPATKGKKAPAARAAGVHRNTVDYHLARDSGFRERASQAAGGIASVGRARRFAGIGLLLLALVAGPGFAIESQPLPLGATGLSLTLRLRLWTEGTQAWVSQSTAGLTVNDLGNGTYSVDNLPAATGTDRYVLEVALSSDPNRTLASYPYGAQPGVRLVWQEEIDVPAAPVKFKRGDTFGSLAIVVKRRLPAAACEGTTTATATVWNVGTGAAVFTDRAAVISDCALDVTTGTYGATVTYSIQAGDLAAVGRYVAEFEICYSTGSCQTLPTENLRFEVVRDFDGN